MTRSCPDRVKMQEIVIEHMSAGLPPITDIARRDWDGRKVPEPEKVVSTRCRIACAQLSLTSRSRSRASGTHRYVGEECFDLAKARWGLPLAFGTPAPVRRYRCPSRSEQRFARMLPLHHSMLCAPFANS